MVCAILCVLTIMCFFNLQPVIQSINIVQLCKSYTVCVAAVFLMYHLFSLCLSIVVIDQSVFLIFSIGFGYFLNAIQIFIAQVFLQFNFTISFPNWFSPTTRKVLRKLTWPAAVLPFALVCWFKMSVVVACDIWQCVCASVLLESFCRVVQCVLPITWWCLFFGLLQQQVFLSRVCLLLCPGLCPSPRYDIGVFSISLLCSSLSRAVRSW